MSNLDTSAQLGDRFLAGIVLHTRRFTYPLGERILTAPIAVLWGL